MIIQGNYKVLTAFLTKMAVYLCLKSDDLNKLGNLYIPQTHRKSESLVKETQTKVNSHIRNYSFDKTNKHTNYISNYAHNNNPNNPMQIKKIHQLISKQIKSTSINNSNTKSVPSPNIHSGKISTSNLSQTNSSHNTNAVHAPIINNFDINSNMNKLKSNDINVRQYIFNQINNKPKFNYKHIRSNSITNQ